MMIKAMYCAYPINELGEKVQVKGVVDAEIDRALRKTEDILEMLRYLARQQHPEWDGRTILVFQKFSIYSGETEAA